MMRHVGVVLLAVCCASTLAQTTRPAPPATAPASVPTTSSAQTPLEALRELLDSVEIGNPHITRLHLHADDETAAVLIEAAERFAGAVASVRAAARERFGEESLDELRVSIVGERTTIEGRVVEERLIPDPLKDAVVSVQGDMASIQFGEDAENALVMRRIDGVWKLPIAEVLSAPNRPPAEALLEAFTTASHRLSQLVDEVRDGQIASAEELSEAMQRAIHGGP